LDFREYLGRRHFANLDGLRFVCISMVLWHHATPGDLQAIQILSRGFLGVDFFFVLSGFLITTLLLREARDYGQFSLRDFYIRRALRILPVYVFVVSAVSFYYVGLKGRSDLADLVPFYYLFLSNFLTDHIPTLSITWSLSV
jgi:peptidoglycan/LPS O-acetylase OafA/YrhL